MEKKVIHRGLKIFLTILGLISLLLCFVFSYLQSAPTSFATEGNTTQNAATGLFVQTLSNTLSVKYPIDITPASWVFITIWPIIYLWNAIGSFYMMSSLCLSRDQSPVMREPAMVPIPSLGMYALTWTCGIAWLFTYDREYFGVALFFLIMMAWSAYAFLAFSYRSYFSDILILEENSNKMLWLVRILIHNGFAIYATWTTCAWKLNLTKVIAYVDSRGIDKMPADLIGNLTVEDAGTVALTLILFELIVWFVLENFVFEAYCRYTVTIYPVLIFAFTGIFVRNYVFPYSRNQILTITGLVLACLAFAVRIPLVVYRHMHRMRHA